MSLIPKKYEEAVDEARALAKESLVVSKEMADTLRRIENLLERILEASQNPTFAIQPLPSNAPVISPSIFPTYTTTTQGDTK